MCHVSCVMVHVSCDKYHVSCVMCHMSCVAYHMSHVTNTSSHSPPPANFHTMHSRTVLHNKKKLICLAVLDHLKGEIANCETISLYTFEVGILFVIHHFDLGPL